MRRLLIALLGFGLATTACGGGGASGERIELSRLGVDFVGKDRRLYGTCDPPGRLMVDFRPGDEITIKSEGRLVVSLSSEEAFIACADVRVEERRLGGSGWLFRRFTRGLKQPTRLLCRTEEAIEVVMNPLYKFETRLVGGSMILSTPPSASGPRRALVASSFEEDDGRSRLHFHTPRCRVSG